MIHRDYFTIFIVIYSTIHRNYLTIFIVMYNIIDRDYSAILIVIYEYSMFRSMISLLRMYEKWLGSSWPKLLSFVAGPTQTKDRPMTDLTAKVYVFVAAFWLTWGLIYQYRMHLPIPQYQSYLYNWIIWLDLFNRNSSICPSDLQSMDDDWLTIML